MNGAVFAGFLMGVVVSGGVVFALWMYKKIEFSFIKRKTTTNSGASTSGNGDDDNQVTGRKTIKK